MPTHPAATFTGPEAAELAVVERSGFIESRHLGAALVLAPDGSLARTIGPVDAPIFARSSLKPIQAATSVSLCPQLQGRQAALATASHAGTPAHVEVVEQMLADGDLTPSDLQCPPAWPGDQAARTQWAASGGGPDRIHMNCSGKHAAMLRAARAQGWPIQTYLDPSHPLQRAIAANLERLAGESIAATGVDGCGAPVFATSLVGLARMIQGCTTAKETSTDPLTAAAARVVSQVRRAPWTIDGPGRADTVMIERLGVFAKGGAEGVQVVATPDGHVAAMKVLDGSPRARAVVTLRLLEQVGAVTPADVSEVLERLSVDVLGGGAVVGQIRASV